MLDSDEFGEDSGPDGELPAWMLADETKPSYWLVCTLCRVGLPDVAVLTCVSRRSWAKAAQT